MKVSDEIRRERKAAVLRSMQKLRAAFPLQQAMEGADPALRAAYVRALSHWTLQGMPPPRDFASNQAIQDLDALVIDECGIPFSARETGIHVHFSGHRVAAMCAIDALAIPRLMQHTSRVAARCVPSVVAISLARSRPTAASTGAIRKACVWSGMPVQSPKAPVAASCVPAFDSSADTAPSCPGRQAFRSPKRRQWGMAFSRSNGGCCTTMSNPDPKRTRSPVALVFCGGGSRGAMEVGFYKAIRGWIWWSVCAGSNAH